MTQPRDLTFEMIDAFYGGGGGGGGGGSADGGQGLGGNWGWGGDAPSSGGGGGGRVAGGGGGSSGPGGTGGVAEGSVYGTYDNMVASYSGQDATSFNLMDSSFGGGRSGSSATSYSPPASETSFVPVAPVSPLATTALNTSLANLPAVGGFNASAQQPEQGFAIPGTVIADDPLAAALGPVGPAGFGLMGPVGLDPLAAATIAASRPSRGAFSLTDFGPAVEEEPLSNVMFDATPMAQQFSGFGPAPSLSAEMFSPSPVSSQGALSSVSRPSMPTRNVEVSRVVSTPSAPLAGSAPALDSRSFSAPIGGGYADMGFTIYDANDGADITFGSGNVESGFAPAPSVAPTSLAPAEPAAPAADPFVEFSPDYFDIPAPSVPSVTQPAPAQAPAQPALPDVSVLAQPVSASLPIDPGFVAALAAARAPDVDPDELDEITFGPSVLATAPNFAPVSLAPSMFDPTPALTRGALATALPGTAAPARSVGTALATGQAVQEPERTLEGYRDSITTRVRTGASNMNLSPDAQRMIDAVVARNIVPELSIISGFRSPKRNNRAGGATGSRHLTGQAVDIAAGNLTDAQRQAIVATAIANGARGIGVYPSGTIHLDTRPTPSIWGPGANRFSGVPVSAMPAWAQTVVGPMMEDRLMNNISATPPSREEAGLARQPGTFGALSAVGAPRAAGLQRADSLLSSVSAPAVAAVAEPATVSAPTPPDPFGAIAARAVNPRDLGFVEAPPPGPTFLDLLGPPVAPVSPVMAEPLAEPLAEIQTAPTPPARPDDIRPAPAPYVDAPIGGPTFVTMPNGEVVPVGPVTSAPLGPLVSAPMPPDPLDRSPPAALVAPDEMMNAQSQLAMARALATPPARPDDLNLVSAPVPPDAAAAVAARALNPALASYVDAPEPGLTFATLPDGTVVSVDPVTSAPLGPIVSAPMPPDPLDRSPFAALTPPDEMMNARSELAQAMALASAIETAQEEDALPPDVMSVATPPARPGDLNLVSVAGPPDPFSAALARAGAVEPDAALEAASRASAGLRSPMGSGFPTGAQMRDINRRADLEPTEEEIAAAEAAMIDALPEGEIGPALDGALPSPDASFEPVTDADLEAARQSLNDYIENEIARQAEFTVPTPRQERANLTGIEYDIVRDALREVPTTLPPEARTVMLADRLTPASMWDERMTPLDFLPSLAAAAPFVDPDMQFASEFMGAIEPTFDEIIAEASPPVAEPPSDPAQLRELMQINPSNVIPGSPEKNAFERNIVPRLFDAAAGVLPIVGPLNTISSIFGGPSVGRFIGERMIPASDPRSFETIMNLPQFSTDTSYDSGDDDVFVSSRGGGDRAPAPPPPAPEPVRRGALSDLRRRYLGAGDDLRRYGMGPEREYYEPVEMAEGGPVEARRQGRATVGDRAQATEDRVLGALGRYAEGSLAGLRRFSDAIDPMQFIDERDVAGFLPGAGMVEGYEQMGTARDKFREGDYLGAAGDYALGAFNSLSDFGPFAPLPAIIIGPGSVDDAVDFARSGRALFHSGEAPHAERMHRYGVEPSHGPWIREIMDEGDEVAPEAAWWARAPEWIKIKVARASGKGLFEVTVDDIRQHGHLAIADMEDYARDAFEIPPSGLVEGERTRVRNLDGDEMRLYETPLYEFDDSAGRGFYPPGIEPGDIVTRETIDPTYTLTGDELVEFMRKYGNLDAEGFAEGGFVDPFAMTDPLMDAGDYINEAAGRRRDEREARGEAFRERLGETWPAQAARAAYEAVTLPGDVYAGRVDPMGDEGIGRAAELGGLVTLGAAAVSAPRGALTMGAARRQSSRMPPKQWYHGTGADISALDDRRILYLTDNADEAGAYARGGHLGGTPGTPRVYEMEAADGAVRNIDDVLFDAMDNGDDLEEAIMQAVQQARKDGIPYIEYMHPSAVSSDDHLVRIAVTPASTMVIRGTR